MKALSDPCIKMTFIFCSGRLRAWPLLKSDPVKAPETMEATFGEKIT